MESTTLTRLAVTALVLAGLLVAAPPAGAGGTNGDSAATVAAAGDGDGMVLRRDGSSAVPFVDLGPRSDVGEYFDWGDAAIGAAAGACGALALLGAAVGVRRRHAAGMGSYG